MADFQLIQGVRFFATQAVGIPPSDWVALQAPTGTEWNLPKGEVCLCQLVAVPASKFSGQNWFVWILGGSMTMRSMKSMPVFC